MLDPSHEGALLMGVPAIADFLGLTERQARHLANKGTLPVFKLKRSALICARPTTLRAWLAQQEAEALAAQSEEKNIRRQGAPND